MATCYMGMWSQSLGPHLSSIQSSSLFLLTVSPKLPSHPQTFLPLSVPLTLYGGVLGRYCVSVVLCLIGKLCMVDQIQPPACFGVPVS